MAAGKTKTDENGVLGGQVENTTPKTAKAQERANTEAIEGSFIYVGPALKTGLRENAVFTGTREAVEEHLKPTIEKYPQVRLLLVTTESLADIKAKVHKRGTLYNKYYTDLASLDNKR